MEEFTRGSFLREVFNQFTGMVKGLNRSFLLCAGCKQLMLGSQWEVFSVA